MYQLEIGPENKAEDLSQETIENFSTLITGLSETITDEDKEDETEETPINTPYVFANSQIFNTPNGTVIYTVENSEPVTVQVVKNEFMHVRGKENTFQGWIKEENLVM